MVVRSITLGPPNSLHLDILIPSSMESCAPNLFKPSECRRTDTACDLDHAKLRQQATRWNTSSVFCSALRAAASRLHAHSMRLDNTNAGCKFRQNAVVIGSCGDSSRWINVLEQTDAGASKVEVPSKDNASTIRASAEPSSPKELGSCLMDHRCRTSHCQRRMVEIRGHTVHETTR